VLHNEGIELAPNEYIRHSSFFCDHAYQRNRAS
jgi:hypothetical protein